MAWEVYSKHPERATPATVNEQLAYEATFKELIEYISEDIQGDETCGDTIESKFNPDGLCGHQHVIGHGEDGTCSSSVNDGGCGIHSTSYGGSDLDPDQNCADDNTSADANCSNLSQDTTCNAGGASASTTSPDEKCSSTDDDGACGHYDADESCGPNTTTRDQACGVTTVSVLGFDTHYYDSDGNCTADDPDRSNIENREV